VKPLRRRDSRSSGARPPAIYLAATSPPAPAAAPAGPCRRKAMGMEGPEMTTAGDASEDFRLLAGERHDEGSGEYQGSSQASVSPRR
jgi:hypothetical protein